MIKIFIWLKRILGIRSPSREVFYYSGFIPELHNGTKIQKDAFKSNNEKIVPLVFKHGEKMEEKKYTARIYLPDKTLAEIQASREAVKRVFGEEFLASMIKSQEDFAEFQQKVSQHIGSKIGGHIMWEWQLDGRYVIRWKGKVDDVEYYFDFSIPYEDILMAIDPLNLVVDGFIIAYKKAIEKG